MSEQVRLVPEQVPPERVEVVGNGRLGGGRFSIYIASGERLVIAIRIEGTEQDHHMVVPKTMVRLLARQAGQTEDPLGFLRRLFREQQGSKGTG